MENTITKHNRINNISNFFEYIRKCGDEILEVLDDSEIIEMLGKAYELFAIIEEKIKHGDMLDSNDEENLELIEKTILIFRVLFHYTKLPDSEFNDMGINNTIMNLIEKIMSFVYGISFDDIKEASEILHDDQDQISETPEGSIQKYEGLNSMDVSLGYRDIDVSKGAITIYTYRIKKLILSVKRITDNHETEIPDDIISNPLFKKMAEIIVNEGDKIKKNEVRLKIVSFASGIINRALMKKNQSLESLCDHFSPVLSYAQEVEKIKAIGSSNKN